MLKSVEEQIKSAMAQGEFDDLLGKGRPLDLDAYFQTPEHLRMAYSVLKNGDFVPEEVQLLKEIEALKEHLKACPDETKARQIRKTLRDKTTNFSLLLDRHKRAGR